MNRMRTVLCAALALAPLAGCNPVLERDFRVVPVQVGDPPLATKVETTLAKFDMLAMSADSDSGFGFRRQWTNLGTGRPGEISINFALDPSGDAWLVKLREWPVSHQTQFGADVERTLIGELAHSGYTMSRSK
jgi:hypothetical protein